jgi:Glycosyltransferase family 87
MPSIAAGRAPIVAALDVSGRPDRLLRAGLWIVTAVVVVLAARDLLSGYPIGVDVEIPLRAAARWIDGGQPYLAASFQAPIGPDLPFLYPPFVLPVIAPLTRLPGGLVILGWLALALAVATWTCRRLAVPWRWVPLILLWPPFLEGLLGGNIQILLFATFVGLLFGPPRPGAAFHPVERAPGRDARPAWVDGLLSVANAAIKPSQAHPWLLVLRQRPGAAVLGAAIVGSCVAASLAVTGPTAWLDWLTQLGRASDPAWIYGGAGLARGLPASVGLALGATTMIAAAVLPRGRGAAWLGILMIVGSPSLRMFGLLTLLPAMLVVRREVALVAAMSIASYTLVGLWLGVAVVSGALAAGSRWPAWIESPRFEGGRSSARAEDVAPNDAPRAGAQTAQAARDPTVGEPTGVPGPGSSSGRS